jgi:hypothetical protein
MSSQVPESSSTPEGSDPDTTVAAADADSSDGVETYREGVFEQGKGNPAGQPGQGVFEQGHAEPVGEGVFHQGHPEREDGSGVFDQDDEKPTTKD